VFSLKLKMPIPISKLSKITLSGQAQAGHWQY
jgi:hypothetical protein